MKVKAVCGMPFVQRSDRISGRDRRRRCFGQDPPIRSAELEGTARLAFEPKSLLVDRSVMPATQQREIRESRGPAFRPVAHVMTLAEPDSTARKAAAVISMLQRTPECRWNRPCPSANLHDSSLLVVPHHYPVRVARQAPGRFRGNAWAVLEYRLPVLIR